MSLNVNPNDTMKDLCPFSAVPAVQQEGAEIITYIKFSSCVKEYCRLYDRVNQECVHNVISKKLSELLQAKK